MSAAASQNGSAGAQAMDQSQAMEMTELLQQPHALEAVASRIAEVLIPQVIAALGAPARPAGAGFVDAASLAALLGVSRSFVYEHAEELGAVPLGDGPRPRLRFDLERARAAYARSAGERSHAAEPQARSGNGATPAIGRPARLPNRLPQPGSVLRVRGES